MTEIVDRSRRDRTLKRASALLLRKLEQSAIAPQEGLRRRKSCPVLKFKRIVPFVEELFGAIAHVADIDEIAVRQCDQGPARGGRPALVGAG